MMFIKELKKKKKPHMQLLEQLFVSQQFDISPLQISYQSVQWGWK